MHGPFVGPLSTFGVIDGDGSADAVPFPSSGTGRDRTCAVRSDQISCFIFDVMFIWLYILLFVYNSINNFVF